MQIREFRLFKYEMYIGDRSKFVRRRIIVCTLCALAMLALLLFCFLDIYPSFAKARQTQNLYGGILIMVLYMWLVLLFLGFSVFFAIDLVRLIAVLRAAKRADGFYNETFFTVRAKIACVLSLVALSAGCFVWCGFLEDLGFLGIFLMLFGMVLLAVTIGILRIRPYRKDARDIGIKTFSALEKKTF